MGSYLRVAIATPLPKLFDYLPGAEDPRPGQRVLVPFGRRKVVGLVHSLAQKTDVPKDKLKTIESILDPEPLLDLEIMALCPWASDYYHYPLGDVLLSTLPKLLREGKPAQTPAENYFRPIPQSTTSLIRAKQQLALFEFLLKYPDGLTSKQIQEAGFSTAVIRHLLEKAFIEKIEKDTFTAIT